MIVKQFLLGFIDLSNVLKNRQNFSIPSSCSSFGRFLATSTSWWLSGSVWQSSTGHSSFCAALFSNFRFLDSLMNILSKKQEPKNSFLLLRGRSFTTISLCCSSSPFWMPIAIPFITRTFGLGPQSVHWNASFSLIVKHWWRTWHKRGARRSSWLIQTLACQATSRSWNCKIGRNPSLGFHLRKSVLTHKFEQIIAQKFAWIFFNRKICANNWAKICANIFETQKFVQIFAQIKANK